MTKKRTAKEPKPKVVKPTPFFRPFAVAKLPGGVKGAPPATAVASAPLPKPNTTAAPAGADATFADLLYGVTPIDRGPRAEPQAPPPVPASGTDAADEEAVRAHLRALVSGGDSRFEVSDDGRRIEGRRIDVDPKVLRRLRRGEFQVDVSCDLHGRGVHEARARVEEIVQRSRERGERCLLLVHGRGNHSPGGEGILRGEMAAWLSQGSASVHVAAFATALPDDGGDGALYVLLRPR